MIVSNLKLKNWRNFRNVDVALQPRQFVVGPNASGKSNLLDAFRFLHDIAKQKGGGLQEAVEKRGGTSKLRCLSARGDSEIIVGVTLNAPGGGNLKWRYKIGIKQEPRGNRQPFISCEEVWEGDKKIIARPDKHDDKDPARLYQTYLEQVNNNREFRDISRFFGKISYMHLVPQLLRHSNEIQGRVLDDDPFGQGFLENIARTPERIRKSRLNRINDVIKNAVPRLDEIKFSRDDATGMPHISAKHTHWRPNAGWQEEDQFSDGTLRLIALLWSLMDGDSLLLLEEPELSLHTEIVRLLSPALYKAQQTKKRQILISTHSTELLSNRGIGGEEVLLLTPTKEGTKVVVSSNIRVIKILLEQGIPVSEVVVPHSNHGSLRQIDIFN